MFIYYGLDRLRVDGDFRISVSILLSDQVQALELLGFCLLLRLPLKVLAATNQEQNEDHCGQSD